MDARLIAKYVKANASEVITDNDTIEYNLYLEKEIDTNDGEIFSISVYVYRDDNTEVLLLKSFVGDEDNIFYLYITDIDKSILLKILLSIMPIDMVLNDMEMLYYFIMYHSHYLNRMKGQFFKLPSEIEISRGSKDTIYLSQLRIYNHNNGISFVYGYVKQLNGVKSSLFKWDEIDEDLRLKIISQIKNEINFAD